MRRNRNNAGFAYIDLLLAVVVTSVALVSLIGLFVLFGKSTIINDSEKAAALLARIQIDYLKRYEGSQYDRLHPHWREICPEVYLTPPNVKLPSTAGQTKYKFQVSSRILKGFVYKDANGNRFDDPNIYDGKSSVDLTNDISIDSELPEEVVRNLNIIPIHIQVTWQETMANGLPAEKHYEIVYYYLSSPKI